MFESRHGYRKWCRRSLNIFLRLRNLAITSTTPLFIYGTSKANQRIESWWSILRKHNSQFLINLFQQIKEGGKYNGNILDKSLITFSLMDIIQVRMIVINKKAC